MKKLFRWGALLTWTFLLFFYGCDDARFLNLEMEVAPKQLQMQTAKNRLVGLLQEGKVIANDVAYQISFLSTYGRTVQVEVIPSGEWGVVFENGSYKLEEGSGIIFDGVGESCALDIKIKDDPNFVRTAEMPTTGPVKSGKMPISVYIRDTENNLLAYGDDALNIFQKDQVLQTIGELIDKWKLNYGNALPFDPLLPEENISNHAIIHSVFEFKQPQIGDPKYESCMRKVPDFHGTGVAGVQIVKDWNLTVELSMKWEEYILTDDKYGSFYMWEPRTEIIDGITPPKGEEFPGKNENFKCTVYDFETGEELDDTYVVVHMKGANAKDLKNQMITGASKPGATNVITGEGNDRLVDLMKSSSTWNIGKTSVFNKVGKYILQWELVNKRPDDKGDKNIIKVGKMRSFIEVVEELENN